MRPVDGSLGPQVNDGMGNTGTHLEMASGHESTGRSKAQHARTHGGEGWEAWILWRDQ